LNGMDTLTFKALKSNNYYSWKVNMRAALVLKDAWSAVSESESYAASQEEERASLNDKAKALMQVKISSELKHLVTSAATAKEA
jgi:hypothetical protein